MAGTDKDQTPLNPPAAAAPGAGAAPPAGAAQGATPGTPAAAAAKQTGRFAYDGLERVIHERSRLSILSSLASHPDGLLFNDLKSLCNLTDGNLSRQLQLLAEAGFVEVWKGFKNNRPQTLCRLTDGGRERFLEYIAVLESVVADAANAPGAKRAAGEDAPGIPGTRGIAPA